MRLFLFAISLLLAVVLAGYFCFCVVMMRRNVSAGRLRLAALLPLALFDESLFNETGNIYRRRALAVNVVLILLLAVFVLMRG